MKRFNLHHLISNTFIQYYERYVHCIVHILYVLIMYFIGGWWKIKRIHFKKRVRDRQG